VKKERKNPRELLRKKEKNFEYRKIFEKSKKKDEYRKRVKK
jgi:hypothetical protein